MGASRAVSDGDGNYISYARPSAITTSAPVSVCVWAKNTGTVAIDSLWSIKDGSTRILAYNAWSSGNGGFAIIGGSSANSQQLSSSVTVSNWHHYAVTWDGSAARATVYVDGVDHSAGTGPSWSDINWHDSIRLCYDLLTHNGAWILAHFEVFERELTANEVLQSVYYPGTQPDTAIYSPIWGVGSNEPDESGNGRDGTISGTATESFDGPPVIIGSPRLAAYGPIAVGGGTVPPLLYHHRHHNQAA